MVVEVERETCTEGPGRGWSWRLFHIKASLTLSLMAALMGFDMFLNAQILRLVSHLHCPGKSYRYHSRNISAAGLATVTEF